MYNLDIITTVNGNTFLILQEPKETTVFHLPAYIKIISFNDGEIHFKNLNAGDMWFQQALMAHSMLLKNKRIQV